ncbi:MAG: DUF2797 domain-containing protein [Pseudomonadota bacterium]
MGDPVDYDLRLFDHTSNSTETLHLNPLLGRRISLHYTGTIRCQHCGRTTSRSFSQGYCFPCCRRLAQCDLCVMSPERCHFDQGTCREPDWGEAFCMQPHLVYLANSSGVKVGITRPSQLPTRWIDQGAVQALPVFGVQTRQQSGFVEVAFKQHISDKTSWQRMLKSEDQRVDLRAIRDRLLTEIGPDIEALQARFGPGAIQPAQGAEVATIRYPVTHYPTRVVALNLDKTPTIDGVLVGIKGQYLIFDTGVINLRRYTSYEVEIEVDLGTGGQLADGNLSLF